MLSKINLTDEADFQGIRESALVDFKTKENSKNREKNMLVFVYTAGPVINKT